MNNNENFLSNIKNESIEIMDRHEEFLKKDDQVENDLILCDPSLIEFTDSNEKINANINSFIRINEEKVNRKNLLNYCGILDPSNFFFKLIRI